MNKRKFDMVAIGRAAIDLNSIEINRPMEETVSFKKYVGGSPVNIAIGSSVLGQKISFIGKVSDDQHGRFIKTYLQKVGVDTNNLVFDNEGHKTGLTFTEILSPKESNILMYREGAADLFLKPEEVNEQTIVESSTLLISGTALSQSPSREAVIKALLIARKNKTKVIFELDYRPYTWKSREETSLYYKLIAQMSDVIIGTRDEFDILENMENNDEATAKELFNYTPELIVIKHGIQGSKAFDKEGNVYLGKAYKANVVKTFGAGDSYASAFIYALNRGLGVETALKYGAASAAIVVSSHSSSEAMPTIEDIEKLIAEQD